VQLTPSSGGFTSARRHRVRTAAFGPTILHEPPPDTPIGSRPRDPKRVRERLGLRFENKDNEELFDRQKQRSHIAYRLDDDSGGVSVPRAALELCYTREELESFLTFRLAGLSRYSLGWPRRRFLGIHRREDKQSALATYCFPVRRKNNRSATPPRTKKGNPPGLNRILF
jgi:hypothetical protein